MYLSWVETQHDWRIAQTHRPRPAAGLRVDLEGLVAAGTDVLVSCLTDEDQLRLGLEAEGEVAQSVGLEFLRYPIVDHSLPDAFDATVAFADTLAERLRGGRAVVVHCFAGIGRSGLILITTLLRLGVPLETAVQAASRARGLLVPETRAQREWLTRVGPASEVAGEAEDG